MNPWTLSPVAKPRRFRVRSKILRRTRKALRVDAQRRARTLSGHRYCEEHYGDGYTEPREGYGYCICSVVLWTARQGYGSYDYTTFHAHLAHAKATRKPLIHRGRTPR